MMRGQLISARPKANVVIAVAAPPAVQQGGERLLTTAEANVFLKRSKGFLEKRRSSGIDSPPYIQTTRNGPVRYRVSDLIAWEDDHMRTSTSEYA